jgi:hypothetical protein
MSPIFRKPRAVPWWTYVTLVVLVIGALTEIPYAAGRRASSPDYIFSGFLMWVDDLTMYFSFIRQAAEGHWLFVNRLTHELHQPAFFNPGFLAVGLLMRWLSLPDVVAFEVWRFVGLAALVSGFAYLMRVVEPRPLVRQVGLVVFAVGGGLGWLVRWLTVSGLWTGSERAFGPYLALDLAMALHPFAQAMLNPHFSLPHGLLLFMMAFFFRGEREGKTRDYLWSAVIALASVSMRPYDLVTLWAVLPIYVLVSPERLLSRRTARRALPLILTAPLVVYNGWLFVLHPVFRFWASQGAVGRIPLLGQCIGLGLPGLAVPWRLLRWRTYPIVSPVERFGLIWMGVLLFLLNAGRWLPLLPSSPQFLVPLMGPVVLLALPVLHLDRDPVEGVGWIRRARIWLPLVLLNAISSGVLLIDRAQIVSTHHRYYHVQTRDRAAFDWLNGHARPDEVVLAEPQDGNRIGRFTSAHVVWGHYGVTPSSARREMEIERLLAGGMTTAEAEDYLRATRVRWIFVHPGRYPGFDPTRIPGCRQEYRNRGVAIYGLSPAPPSPSANEPDEARRQLASSTSA